MPARPREIVAFVVLAIGGAWAALFGHAGLSVTSGALPASGRAALLAQQPLIQTLLGGLPIRSLTDGGILKLMPYTIRVQ